VQFLRNRSAGISLGNFNALDLWVWNSLFEDCGVGVTNGEGAGNFHVYSSVFRRSRQADLAMGNTGGFSARGNFSSGSRAFFVSTVPKAYPAVIHLQRNVVVDPTGAPVVDLLNQGPGLLTDNVFLLPPATPGPAVRWSALDGADVTSIGNTFSVTRRIENNGRLIAIGDRKVAADAARPAEPAVEPPPATPMPRIVDVRQGSTARDIQNAIDKAATIDAVVHVPSGEYLIDRTLTIPASHVWFVGDGGRTLLHWTGKTSGPVILITGRSHATVSDIKIDAAGKADGLALSGADVEDGVVRLDRVQLRAAVRTDLLIDQLDDTVVDVRDFGHAYSPGGAAVKAIGGPRLAAGEPARAALNVFSGAASGNGISYDVSRGARVLIRDFWYESGAAPGFATVSDRAVLTLDGSRIASEANGTPAAVGIAAPDGRVAILASHLDDRVAINGDLRRLRVLALSSFDEQEMPSFVIGASAPGILTVANTRRKAAGRRGNASVAAPDVGTADTSIIEDLVRHARSSWPDFSTARPSGATDVRLVRVWIEHGLTNLTIAR
jgi:hypothetical protein